METSFHRNFWIALLLAILYWWVCLKFKTFWKFDRFPPLPWSWDREWPVQRKYSQRTKYRSEKSSPGLLIESQVLCRIESLRYWCMVGSDKSRLWQGPNRRFWHSSYRLLECFKVSNLYVECAFCAFPLNHSIFGIEWA